MRGISKNPNELFTVRSSEGKKGTISRRDLAMLAKMYLVTGMTTDEVSQRLPLGKMSIAAIQANLNR